MSGFFTVKSNNNGTFYILSSGGKSELYLSHTGEPSGKVLIMMNLQYNFNYFQVPREDTITQLSL